MEEHEFSAAETREIEDELERRMKMMVLEDFEYLEEEDDLPELILDEPPSTNNYIFENILSKLQNYTIDLQDFDNDRSLKDSFSIPAEKPFLEMDDHVKRDAEEQLDVNLYTALGENLEMDKCEVGSSSSTEISNPENRDCESMVNDNDVQVDNETQPNTVTLIKEKDDSTHFNAACIIQACIRRFLVQRSTIGKKVKASIDSRRHLLKAKKAERLEFEERQRLLQIAQANDAMQLQQQKSQEVENRRKEERTKREKLEDEKRIQEKLKHEKIRREKLELERLRNEHILIQKQKQEKLKQDLVEQEELKQKTLQEERVADFTKNLALKKRKEACRLIQNWWRHQIRLKYIRKNCAARSIQSYWKFYKSVKLKRQCAAITIQKYWRGYIHRKIFREKCRATLVIQQYWKQYSIDKEEKHDETQKDEIFENVEKLLKLNGQKTLNVDEIGPFSIDKLKTSLKRYRTINKSVIHIDETANFEEGTIMKNISSRYHKAKIPTANIAITALSNETLRVLDLSKVCLRFFEADLPNLEVLNLSFNRLVQITNLRCPRLVHFDVSENQLSRWSITSLPHCHVINAAGNQLISISELAQKAPRVFSLNVAENFLVETPKDLDYLSNLNINNNSVTRLFIGSIFLVKADLSFNTLEEDEEIKMFPLLQNDGLIIYDHISSNQPNMASAVKFHGFHNFKSYLREYGLNLSFLTHVDNLMSLARIIESCSLLNIHYSQYLRRYYQQLHLIKKYFYDLLDINYNTSNELCAKRIQRWWRIKSGVHAAKLRRKRAVSVIEAWWIGTTTKRRIKEALGTISKTTFGGEDFGMDDFDISSIENQFFEIETNLANEEAKINEHRLKIKSKIIPVNSESERPNSSENRRKIQSLLEKHVPEIIPLDKVDDRDSDSPSITEVGTTLSNSSSKLSRPKTAKVSKIQQFRESWGVSEKTASLMLKRQKIMKGSENKKYIFHPKKNIEIPTDCSKSETDAANLVKRQDALQINARSEYNFPYQSRVRRWVNQVDNRHIPTEDFSKVPLTQFSNSTSQLLKSKTVKPLPPIRKSRAWI